MALMQEQLKLQGLFADCIYVGSGEPARVLCLLENKYTGYKRVFRLEPYSVRSGNIV